MEKYQYFDVTLEKDITVVRLVDPARVDRLLIHEPGNELVDFIERRQPEMLLIDFRNVTHFSSELIGGLLRARKRIRSLGGDLKLCEMSVGVRDLFRLTHLDGTVFQIYDTATEAKFAFY